MDDSSKDTRRVKVIDGRLQYRLIATSLAVIAGGLLFTAAVIGLAFFLARSGGGSLRPDLLMDIVPALLVNDLAIMILLVIVGITTTHRIAGPVFRMESDIAGVLAGSRGVRVRLRREDAFPELADKVNRLIERLEDQRKD